MKDNFSRGFGGLSRTFNGFTIGQKVVAIVGTGALLLGGFLVFRWASTPSYAPLFSNLASSDASAVVQQLDTSGVPYKLSNGGNTILVPQDQVYSARIDLAGQGLPAASDTGYSLLDNQGLSTSSFQERTNYKRAMEGELSNTIEAIDGVDAAIVHLAMPEKQVFSDTQDPTTASVLVKTRVGSTMTPEQVQAVVNLVSSSVDGLSADKVTVTDGTGKVLYAPGSTGAGGAQQGQTQQVLDFQNRMTSQVQTMLDQVVGPGNAAVTVTPVLSFDKLSSETTRYFGKGVVLSKAAASEQLKGNPSATANGVVGAAGQTELDANGNPVAGTNGTGNYTKKNETVDQGWDNTVEHREAAPGQVQSLHLAVVLDTKALAGRDPALIQTSIASALGIDPKRGDTIDVTSLPFDRTAQTAAAKELKAATAADKKAATMGMAKNGGLVLVVLVIMVIAWLQSRKRNKARAEATSYVVEQLKRDAALREAQAQLEIPNAAMLALESQDNDMTREVRDEIASLVERQPEDVAALLRGWLVERS